MIRRAFLMQLKPGALDEYTHQHDNLWPELVTEIRRSGVAQMTTFELDSQLFLYSEIHNEDAWALLWGSEVHRRWGGVMEPLMEFGDDGLIKSWDLQPAFHIEVPAADWFAGKTPIRRAFKLRLRPGCLDEYVRGHESPWPELVSLFHDEGVAEISSFAHGIDLFVYSVILDPDAWTRVWAAETHDRWAGQFESMMQFGEDGKLQSWEMHQIFNHDATRPL